ncbi:hypothetical protein VNO78_03312 [Psophocarpus tetragonolobus]|uniref:Uncharacterized protein n=1 Tax=Psophocarpus tetragonolobus TaxID=3891 RepID=A0AAN9XWU3_PSOTE
MVSKAEVQKGQLRITEKVQLLFMKFSYYPLNKIECSNLVETRGEVPCGAEEAQVEMESKVLDNKEVRRD